MNSLLLLIVRPYALDNNSFNNLTLVGFGLVSSLDLYSNDKPTNTVIFCTSLLLIICLVAAFF